MRPVRPWLAMVLALLAAAALGWLTGWAVLVPVAGVPATVLLVQRHGARVWRTGAALTVLVAVVGQLAVHAGLLPTVVDPPGVHVAAAATLALSLLAIAAVGRSAAARERTERILARTQARLSALMDTSDDVLTVCDADGRLTYVSPAVQRAMGYHPEGLVGTRLLDLVDVESRLVVAERLAEVVAGGPGSEATMDVLVVHASQERRWYEWAAVNLLDDPLVEGVVVDQRDVTERLLHSEALARAAAHDGLTGLPNRTELMRRLRAVLPQATPGAAIAVLFIDLDRFKEVNDTLGHAAGDELLVVVARRLEAALRHHDHLARLGGDEFCAILTEIRDEGEVRTVVERLQEGLGQPVSLAGQVVHVGASIGSALTTEGDQDPASLFAAADAAMYEVKRAQRAQRSETAQRRTADVREREDPRT